MPTIAVQMTIEGFHRIKPILYWILLSINAVIVYVLNPAHVPLSWANSPTLGTYYSPRMWWADIEVPNLLVDVNSWRRSACSICYHPYRWLILSVHTFFALQKKRRENHFDFYQSSDYVMHWYENSVSALWENWNFSTSLWTFRFYFLKRCKFALIELQQSWASWSCFCNSLIYIFSSFFKLEGQQAKLSLE